MGRAGDGVGPARGQKLGWLGRGRSGPAGLGWVVGLPGWDLGWV